jgi:UDP-GlcNAc:undecaprenyl-phosphate GlcNAc-1-phosphate transferase
LAIAFVSPLVAAIVTLLLIAWMLKAGARLPLDLPNERSLHQRPVPRSGGLAIMAGILTGFAILQVPLVIVLPAAMLVVVSHFDDLRGLPIAARFGAHFAAAIWFVYGALPALPWPLLVLIVIGIVWVTNLYNFMDGSDGLAGGMAVIGFGAFAFAAFQANSLPLAFTAAAIASASGGFLMHNFPPARVFLGDAGSVPLGFLAGALGLHGALIDAWPAWFPILVFSPFIVDATLTLARRVARGEPFWKAHRGHLYQRLVLGGWTPRRLAWGCYALMAAAAASALVGRTAEPLVGFGIILFWAAAYALLFIAIGRRTRAA